MRAIIVVTSFAILSFASLAEESDEETMAKMISSSFGITVTEWLRKIPRSVTSRDGGSVVP